MADVDIEIVNITDENSYVLKIKNDLAYRIYKTATSEIRFVLSCGEPYPQEDKLLVVLPIHLIDTLSRTLVRLCCPDSVAVLNPNGYTYSDEPINPEKRNIKDIWANDDF